MTNNTNQVNNDNTKITIIVITIFYFQRYCCQAYTYNYYKNKSNNVEMENQLRLQARVNQIYCDHTGGSLKTYLHIDLMLLICEAQQTYKGSAPESRRKPRCSRRGHQSQDGARSRQPTHEDQTDSKKFRRGFSIEGAISSSRCCHFLWDE